MSKIRCVSEIRHADLRKERLRGNEGFGGDYGDGTYNAYSLRHAWRGFEKDKDQKENWMKVDQTIIRSRLRVFNIRSSKASSVLILRYVMLFLAQK